MANATRKRTPTIRQPDTVMPPQASPDRLRARGPGIDGGSPLDELQVRSALRDAPFARTAVGTNVGLRAIRDGHDDALRG